VLKALLPLLWLHLSVELPRLNHLFNWQARHLVWPHPELSTQKVKDYLWRRHDWLPNRQPPSSEPYLGSRVFPEAHFSIVAVRASIGASITSVIASPLIPLKL